MSYWFCSEFYRLSSSAKILKIGIKIWQSYREFQGGPFFETQCTLAKQCSSLSKVSLTRRSYDFVLKLGRCDNRDVKVAQYFFLLFICVYFVFSVSNATMILCCGLESYKSTRKVAAPRTCLAAVSSSRPSPTTTYVHLRPKRDTIRSKQLSLPRLDHTHITATLS